MMSGHTLKHMRAAFFEGNGVSDRSIREVWEKEGGREARQKAREIDRALRDAFSIHLPVEPKLPG